LVTAAAGDNSKAVDEAGLSVTILAVRRLQRSRWQGRDGLSKMAKGSEELDIRTLEQRLEQIRREMGALGDLRPGSLVERYRRCGKSGCHCMREGERGHGPAWSLTRSLGGRTVTRLVPAGAAVELTRAHLAEYRRLRRLLAEFLELSEKLCEARLRTVLSGDRSAQQEL
jgi:hypothetical protein